MITHCLAVALTLSAAAQSAEPIRALLITGHNNHNWKYTSRVHADTLEATGRFDVDITDTPEKTLAEGLDGYRVFVLDYNDYGSPRRWGPAAEAAFVKAVSDGAGVVAIHSADNSFDGWEEYEKMLGLMWREGTGHGPFHAFDVEWVDAEHPITKGLPDWKAHPDELYHKLVNVRNSPYHLLARAMSATDKGGTGRHEPMAYTLAYGKGRVFATPLGHVWTQSPDQVEGRDSQKASIADPMFKSLIARGAEWAATGGVTLPAAWKDVRAQNTLGPECRDNGWRLLFDGATTANWRGFRKDSFPDKGWAIRDGALVVMGGGGDICTAEEYGDFEFECEWRVSPGGNSGIMYRCSEDHTYPWETGPEYQILDDARHKDGQKAKTRAGSLYDVVAPGADVVRPAGEWNRARIVARGTRLQHFLNDILIVDIDTAGDVYKAAHAASKWPGMKNYNTKPKGRICLQDHGDEVAFRNIKVKRLD